MCAPSNKAVQVLALRFLKEHPYAAVIFVGVESKLQPELEPIAYHSFFDRLQALLDSCCEVVRKAQAVKPVYSVNETKYVIKAMVLFKRYIQEVAASIVRYTIKSISEQTMSICDRVVELYDYCIDRGAIKKIDGSEYGFYSYYWEELTNCPKELHRLINGNREHIEEQIMKHSTIVFSTLSVSGRESMLELVHPSVLIVDEAGQSVEAETLIAFQHSPIKVLLVGDTKQLPATVISPVAKNAHYDWSMMYRLADLCQQPTLMLEEQYRMHPSISSWPSKQYYNGRLRNGASIDTRPGLYNFPDFMHPYAFYDLPPSKNNKEKSVGSSTENEYEAHYIALAVSKLRRSCPNASVGIITPYTAQVRCIERELRKEKQQLNAALRVSSVDGFQGDECDVIFISFVRCNNIVGFVDDAQRLNVAITRAKYALFMVGSEATLKRSAEFKSMFNDARFRGSFYTEEALMAALDILPIPAKKGRCGEKASAQDVEYAFMPPMPPAVQSQRITKNQSKVDHRNVDKVAYEMAENLHVSVPVLKMSGGPVCSHYARGSCRYGKNCKFAHI